MTWWYRNLEIGRVDHDKNFEVHGQGPLSLLEVAPLSGKYFGDYSCRAENIHGSANHSLELVMAREPTIIQQAVLDRVGSGPGSAHCALSVSRPGHLHHAPLPLRAAHQHRRAAAGRLRGGVQGDAARVEPRPAPRVAARWAWHNHGEYPY